MVFQVKSKTEVFKMPNYGGLPNVYFVGAWFRMEKGPEATPPKYEYDEIGVVVEGEINFRDESGQTATAKTGDTFYFPRGSIITFSSNSYGVAWKCGSRPLTKL